MIPRWTHRLYARVAGYYWLPCPLCGREFGGHEHREIKGRLSTIPKPGEPGTHLHICPKCSAAGKGVR